MEEKEQVRPSSGYYLLAFLFCACGIALMIYFLVADIHRIRDSMVRMDIPGQMDLELKRHETYTVFVEHWSPPVFGGMTPDFTPRQVSCEVHMLPSGEKIETKANRRTWTYSAGDHKGASVLEFEVPHDGTYMMGCNGPSKLYQKSVQVAVGGGASKAISTVVAKSFVVLAVGLVGGMLVTVRVTKLRLESRREIRERGRKPV
jgi:hypothetical protein